MKAIDGTWPKQHEDGTPAIEFHPTEEDCFWLEGAETFVCYDCLE